MALFNRKYMTFYLLAIVMSFTVYEIFANQIKCQKFDLENEDQGQGEEKPGLRHSAGDVLFYVILSEF